jgi:hypothetical protein
MLPARAVVQQAKKKRRAMTWTLTNLIIEIIAGIVGGHAIAAAAKEHSWSWIRPATPIRAPIK